MSTLKRCCGSDFTPLAKSGWIKLISRMLDEIIPIVVTFELSNCGNVMLSLLETRCLPHETNHLNSATAVSAVSAVVVTSSSCSCPCNNINNNTNNTVTCSVNNI